MASYLFYISFLILGAISTDVTIFKIFPGINGISPACKTAYKEPRSVPRYLSM